MKTEKKEVAIDSVPSCILVEYEEMRRDFLIIKKNWFIIIQMWGEFLFCFSFVWFTWGFLFVILRAEPKALH